jgi:hypothetical protein
VNLVIAIVLITALSFIVFNKLFAVDAQVKAGEVSLQAGKWNKLLLTYAMEYEKLGSFEEIGYVPYGKIASDGESSKSKVFNYSSDLKNGKGRFLAINRVSLDNCLRYEGYWLAYGNPEQMVGNAVVELPVSRCAILTPYFELLRNF